MLIVSQDLGVNKVVQENWELNVYIKIVIVSKLNGKRGPINSSTPPMNGLEVQESLSEAFHVMLIN